MAVLNTKEKSFKVVAAIDIGTPFSTYAYSTTNGFQKDPLDIHQIKTWYSDSKRKGITKRATCLLLDKKLRFISFGNDAQEQYAQLKHSGKSREYLFFRHFNLQLYDSKEPIIRLQLNDLDGNGKASAKRVYAAAIISLKNELLQQFETDERLLNESDIHWILSIPVALPEDSSSFMKECAKQAGIQAEQLSIVYESEAVSIYLQYLGTQNKDNTLIPAEPLGIHSIGDVGICQRIDVNYIIANLAGKSLEVTVIKRDINGKMSNLEKYKVIHKDTTFGIWNDLVDLEFWKILIRIFGQPFLTKINEEKPNSYMRIFKHFNEMKTKNANFLTMWFPGKMWNTLFQSYATESIDEAIYCSPYRKDIKIYHEADRMQMSLKTLQSCFQSTVDCLLSLLDTVFNTNTSRRLRDIIIVGDLAESEIVQTQVKKHFPSKRIHVPVLPNVAIVKGAVLFGHAPEIIGRTIKSKCSSINTYLAVVAIDFGTANSGFAFSTRDRYKACPLNISLMKIKRTTDPKTSTSVLLDDEARFVEFGRKAQDKYAHIQTTDKKDSYYYFENFKMMLYNSKIPLRKLRLTDIQDNPNKTMLAQDVVASIIQALRKNALEEMKRNGTQASEDEIRWVLTVPAIWPDDAKLFMRESAAQAGIPTERLLIALEPEVASVYVQWLETDKSESGGYSVAAPGTKYLVADIGGGTTDITVHEKLHSGKIKEINKASGEGCGGRSVDAAFFQKLDDIFGKDLMKRIKSEKPKSYLDLHRYFEELKRRVKCKNEDDDSIKFPCQITNEWLGGDSATADLAKSKNFVIRDGKLIMPHDTLIEIFKPTISAIIQNIKEALRFDISNEVSIIMLVGGFAKNDILRNEIKMNFHPKRIITAPDANLAVLKGAVLYGHKPESIDPRVTRYTYGVETTLPFLPQVHEEHRKCIDDSGKACCRGIFWLIIRANETVKLGTTIKQVYKIPSLSNEIDIQIFATEKGLPMYTNTEGCRKIGTLTVSIPRPSEEEREIEVAFIFGNTELNVRAVETRYRKEAVAYLSLE